jgi:hypothetical protein
MPSSMGVRRQHAVLPVQRTAAGLREAQEHGSPRIQLAGDVSTEWQVRLAK